MKMEKISALVALIMLIGILLVVAIFFKYEEKGKEMIQKGKNISTITVKNLSIIVIYDNNPYKKELKTAWGFSCFIKGPEKTILFDTGGNGSILVKNMEKLGINPKEIDFVVLSHAHWDHVGGLHAIIEKNPTVTVYILKSFPRSFKEDLIKHGIKTVEVQEPLKICEGFYTTGELGTWIKEQSLLIDTEKGVIVITGCAHPGIVKIVSKAKDLVKNDVLLVIGGFHLSDKSKEEIEKIVFNFRRLGVSYVGPCHCSGRTAKDLFKKEYGKNFLDIGVGKKLTISSL